MLIRGIDCDVTTVSFYSFEEELRGELYKPRGVTQAPGVIMAHGMSGLRFETTQTVLERLVGFGYVVLSFDWRGCSGPIDVPRDVLPTRIVEDLQSAVTFMLTRPEVLDSRISLFGQTFGGGIVVYAAALDPRVRCVVSLNGFSDGERWLKALHRSGDWERLQEDIVEDARGRVLSGGAGMSIPNLKVIMPYRYEEMEAGGGVGSTRVLLTLRSVDALIRFKPETVAHLIAPRHLAIVHAADGQLVPTVEAVALRKAAGDTASLELIDAAAGFDLYGPFNPSGFDRAIAECGHHLSAYA